MNVHLSYFVNPSLVQKSRFVNVIHTTHRAADSRGSVAKRVRSRRRTLRMTSAFEINFSVYGLWGWGAFVLTCLKCWPHRSFVVQVTLEASEHFADFFGLPEVGNGVRNGVVIFET